MERTELFEIELFWHLNVCKKTLRKLNWIVLFIGQTELNFVLMLNWIVWNGIIFVCLKELLEIVLLWHFLSVKKYTYTKLNCLKYNCLYV